MKGLDASTVLRHSWTVTEMLQINEAFSGRLRELWESENSPQQLAQRLNAALSGLPSAASTTTAIGGESDFDRGVKLFYSLTKNGVIHRKEVYRAMQKDVVLGRNDCNRNRLLSTICSSEQRKGNVAKGARGFYEVVNK